MITIGLLGKSMPCIKKSLITVEKCWMFMVQGVDCQVLSQVHTTGF